MKFRNKPVVIEAIEVRAWNADSTSKWCGGIVVRNENRHCLGIDIPTLEGTMRAGLGDWIIKGVKGFYPCKPDIFVATYEAVVANSATPQQLQMPGTPAEEKP